VTDPNTGKTSLKASLPENIAVLAQAGGDEADLMLALGSNNVQFGEGGDDVALAVGTMHYVFGGGGMDFLLSGRDVVQLAADLETLAEADAGIVNLASLAPGSLFSGGDGADAIFTLGALGRLMLDGAFDDLPVVQAFNEARAALVGAVDAIMQPVRAVHAAMAEAVDGLPELPDLPSFKLAPNLFIGGAGDDILSGETGQERLVGDAGDDTYVVWFGEGDTVVDERGFGMLQDLADWAGAAIPALGDMLPTGGGNDVLEIRRAGLFSLDTFDFTVDREGSDLVLGFRSLDGLDTQGSVRVVGMDGAAGRIETLRLVDGGDSFAFDLAGAFAAAGTGSVDLADFALGRSTGDAVANTILGRLGGVADTIALFGQVRGAAVADLLHDGAATVAHALGLEAPEDHLLYA
jgi:hypothetical protein